MDTENKYWETKTLDQMNEKEWENLCDGCGKCCLHKFIDEQTNEVHFSSIACKLLDPLSCQCSDYKNRLKEVPTCLKINLENPKIWSWLPGSCSYLLIYQKKPLPSWHHLISGDKDLVHKKKRSVSGRVIFEDDLDHGEAIEDYIIYE